MTDPGSLEVDPAGPIEVALPAPLTVPGVLDALDDIAMFVLSAAGAANLDKKATYRLRLAVDEIATNIITHGYEEAGLSGAVVLTAGMSPEALTITLEDDARPYDPLSTRMPDDLNAPLEERGVGGLGVYLTLLGVDEFRYRLHEGRNVNEFVMWRGTRPVTAEVAMPGTSVLVYETNLNAQSSLSVALKGAGYTVFTAATPESAIRALEAGELHLLILPDDTPPEDAEGILKALATLSLERCPALLAYGSRPEGMNAVRALLKLGVPDYLSAPLEPDLVRARVEAALERKRLSEHQEDVRQKAELLLLERDVQIGRDIQLSFLPETLPQPQGWELAAFFRPAREVAGDFYDAFELVNGRRLAFVIADVCDKGVGAALFMALFRTLIRSNSEAMNSSGTRSPGDWFPAVPGERRRSVPSIGTMPLMSAIAGTNEYITTNHGMTGYFATVFMGVLDPQSGNLIYINGGHNPPVLVRASGEHEFLRPTGPAVGMLPGAKFTIGQAQLLPGDALFCHTDGVTDAKNIEGGFFKEKRLYDLLAGSTTSATSTVDLVRDELLRHIGAAAQFDDITMMCVRRAPDE